MPPAEIVKKLETFPRSAKAHPIVFCLTADLPARLVEVPIIVVQGVDFVMPRAIPAPQLATSAERAKRTK